MMRLAAYLHPQHCDFEGLRTAVLRAEDLGFEVAYTWDHFFPLFGDQSDKTLECWTTLAAWAEATRTIEIGSLVTCNSYRNPNLVADMARTVDNISDGRLILGIGAGWFERDYTAYGYDYGTARSRLAALERDLPIIADRMRQLDPPPRRNIPILIGGGGERITLRLVAEHAQMWHHFGGPGEMARKIEVLSRHCEAVGRDLADIEISAGVDLDQAHEVPRICDEYYECGVRQLTLGFGGPDYDMTLASEFLRWRDTSGALSAS